MAKVLVNGGMPYSDDFLQQLGDDLRKLATDFEKATGDTAKDKTLLKAMNVVRHIEMLNDDGTQGL